MCIVWAGEQGEAESLSQVKKNLIHHEQSWLGHISALVSKEGENTQFSECSGRLDPNWAKVSTGKHLMQEEEGKGYSPSQNVACQKSAVLRQAFSVCMWYSSHRA